MKLFRTKSTNKQKAKKEKPQPRVLRETANYRLVIVPYSLGKIKEGDKVVDEMWCEQLLIEKKATDSLGVPQFVKVDYDVNPTAEYNCFDRSRELWDFLKEAFGV